MEANAPKECRVLARECLKLANEAQEFYVRSALVELAQKFEQQAAESERREQTAIDKAERKFG